VVPCIAVRLEFGPDLALRTMPRKVIEIRLLDALQSCDVERSAGGYSKAIDLFGKQLAFRFLNLSEWAAKHHGVRYVPTVQACDVTSYEPFVVLGGAARAAGQGNGHSETDEDGDRSERWPATS
jgi:hypothetical protein